MLESSSEPWDPFTTIDSKKGLSLIFLRDFMTSWDDCIPYALFDPSDVSIWYGWYIVHLKVFYRLFSFPNVNHSCTRTKSCTDMDLLGLVTMNEIEHKK